MLIYMGMEAGSERQGAQGEIRSDWKDEGRKDPRC